MTEMVQGQPDIRRLTRQLDVIPTEVLSTPIHVIGVGAVGSFVALALAKMGFFNMTIYDPDTVSIENLNVQFYRSSDLHRLKTAALADIIDAFCAVKVRRIDRKFLPTDPLSGIVITALDSMAARQQVWDAVKGKFQVRLLIDPRMSVETASCDTARPMNKEDVDDYDATFFPDSEAVQERCTAKSTMYTCLLLAGHVAKVVKDFLVREDHDYVAKLLWDIGSNTLNSWWKYQGSTNPLANVERLDEEDEEADQDELVVAPTIIEDEEARIRFEPLDDEDEDDEEIGHVEHHVEVVRVRPAPGFNVESVITPAPQDIQPGDVLMVDGEPRTVIEIDNVGATLSVRDPASPRAPGAPSSDEEG